MYPDQIIMVVDFAQSRFKNRPSLHFYNFATQRPNRQQGLANKSKKRYQTAEKGFNFLSDKLNL